MTREEAKKTIEDLRQHLMDEMTDAANSRNFDRVSDVQTGFTALSVLERVAGGEE